MLFARSILTTPWIELGGRCNISCEKTGYTALVEFHTKPFYGGKKNQVTGKVFEPGNSKPTCTINGEWNGVMWAEYNSGVGDEIDCTVTEAFTIPGAIVGAGVKLKFQDAHSFL